MTTPSGYTDDDVFELQDEVQRLTGDLAVATDMAMQRGKRIDELETHLRDAHITIRTLVGVDGG